MFQSDGKKENFYYGPAARQRSIQCSFYGVSTLLGSFNAKLNFKQFSLVLSTVFVFTKLNVKTVLFQTIQFSISTQFSSTRPIDRTLSDATALGKSGHEYDSNDGLLRIPQCSRITGISPSDCLVSYYQDILAGGGGLTHHLHFRKAVCILQTQPTRQLSEIERLFD